MQNRIRLEADALPLLLDRLQQDGRQLVGPTERDGAIVLDLIEGVGDLPAGRTADTGPGRYRLRDQPDGALFQHPVGPDSARRWLHPARLELWRAEQVDGQLLFQLPPRRPARYALLGLRACDLMAVAIQDRVLREAEVADPHYASRRAEVLLVATQCAASAPTCFCHSMNAGPRVGEAAFDLCLTEVRDDAPHFIIEAGSPAGRALLEGLGAPSTSRAPEEAAACAEGQQNACPHAMPPDIRATLLAALRSPRWDEIGARCLSCANCTLVCPTCFCTTVEDVTLLTGEAVHSRRWDSCFADGFSDLHGQPVRRHTGERYRQWMTHKLATWHDQFDTSGCVGCGRCTVWCPAGIDFLAEARGFAADADAARGDAP